MKISRIRTFPVRVPLKPEYRMVSALGRHDVSEFLLVRVETDADIDGAGEATVLSRWSGETVWSAQALVDRVFAPLLIGIDVDDMDAINARMDNAAVGNWFTKSAIEMACYDIRGKNAGRPIYELLGGAVRDRTIRCRFSMGAYPPERARRRARELVDAGFTTIKVKVGTDPQADIERVRAVREEIGSDPDLVIDANCGYDAPTAIRVAGELHDCRIDLFEQPTPRGDFHALAQVRTTSGVPVMADDTCFNLTDAQECVRNNACDVISVYPGKNAGIDKSKRIVDFCAAHEVACSIGSNLELDVASAAMCHLVVACRNLNVETYPGDIMGPDYHEFSVVSEPLVINGPCITLPDRPGLGVDVDWAVVEQNPCN